MLYVMLCFMVRYRKIRYVPYLHYYISLSLEEVQNQADLPRHDVCPPCTHEQVGFQAEESEESDAAPKPQTLNPLPATPKPLHDKGCVGKAELKD